MSGSESGVITSSGRGDGFTMNMPKNPTQSQQVIQNMRLAFTSDGTAVYQPITATVASPPYQNPTHQEPAMNSPAPGAVPMPLPQPNSAAGESIKRKRGRPRKYGPDGTMSLVLTSSSPPQSANSPPPPAAAAAAPGFPSPAPPQGNSAAGSGSVAGDGNSMKKARGRPPGSLNKKNQQQFDAHGPIGVGFTPHIITVRAGEDVSSKIMSFSQHGPRAVCILSANGAISNVTLRQSTSSGGTVTFEGRFEILSLTGSFMLCEHGGQKSRSGGLSVSLSGPDGRILGGSVAGLLIAASPVQVVVGSFVVEGKKEPKSINQVDPSGTARFAPSGSTGASSPQSRGTLSESSGGPGSPLNQNTGVSNNNNAQGISSMPWK